MKLFNYYIIVSLVTIFSCTDTTLSNKKDANDFEKTEYLTEEINAFKFYNIINNRMEGEQQKYGFKSNDSLVYLEAPINKVFFLIDSSKKTEYPFKADKKVSFFVLDSNNVKSISRGKILVKDDLVVYISNSHNQIVELIFMDKKLTPKFYTRLHSHNMLEDTYSTSFISKFKNNYFILTDTINLVINYNYDGLKELNSYCTAIQGNLGYTMKTQEKLYEDLPIWMNFDRRFFVLPMVWENISIDTLYLTK